MKASPHRPSLPCSTVHKPTPSPSLPNSRRSPPPCRTTAATSPPARSPTSPDHPVEIHHLRSSSPFSLASSSPPPDHLACDHPLPLHRSQALYHSPPDLLPPLTPPLFPLRPLDNADFPTTPLRLPLREPAAPSATLLWSDLMPARPRLPTSQIHSLPLPQVPPSSRSGHVPIPAVLVESSTPGFRPSGPYLWLASASTASGRAEIPPPSPNTGMKIPLPLHGS